MTQITPDFDDELEPGEQQGESNDIRNLRRKAKNAERLEAENATLQEKARKLAFIEAGVDVSTPVGSLFARAFDGDIDDTDAIKAAYAELGGATTTTEEPDVPPTDTSEATRERQALAAGAAGDTGEQPPAPVRGEKGRAVKAGQDAMARGAARDDAMGATFGELVGAAAAGDHTVIVPGFGEGPAS